MSETRRVSGGTQFYMEGDWDANRPLQVSQKADGGFLLVEETDKKGGPSKTATGWRVVGGRVRAMRIGTGKWTTFPPEGTNPLIFFPTRKR